MALIVQKFGGTSVGDPDRIRRVARRVADTHRDGNEVIVVVSAMGKSTDELIALAGDISPNPPAREMDM
ncbi:MAG: aspartate kinase, partial [Acidimicrobiia bacterium]|nr:aspartate kinase [Acidimicrobiia bacterium]